MPVVLRPLAEFDMTFKGSKGDAIFKCIENKESRELSGNYQIVYDVFLNPVNDGLFTTNIWTEAEIVARGLWSDEILVGWNVWEATSWSFYDKTLVKHWPPVCTRVSHNSYRVAIRFSPLFIMDFETTPITVKKLSSNDVAVLDFNENGDPAWLNLDQFDKEKQQALHFINVDKHGKTQGVNIIEPSFSWTERWLWGPVKSLDESKYLNTLAEITATVNLSKFRGFKKYEVLFRGASGRYTGPMTYEIDYRFSRRPTRKNVNIGGVSKEKPAEFQGPWNIDDFETSTKIELEIEENGRKYIIEKPDLVKVHQVFEKGDFSRLFIYDSIPLGESRIWEKTELANQAPLLEPGGRWQPPARATISNKVN